MPHFIVSVFALTLLIGCSNADNPSTSATDCDDSALASGIIVREFTDTTYNEPVIFSDMSRATIRVFAVQGVDGPSTDLSSQHIEGSFELPLSFCVLGETTSLMFNSQGEYRISAKLEQVKDAHTIGDLISETITVIEPPMTDVRLTVSGLESCDAPHAGGFCL